ncbi:MAG: hypothetical protein ACYTFZ_08740 [Planctomycetota bacterium]|jgi:hypothetical protein
MKLMSRGGYIFHLLKVGAAVRALESKIDADGRLSCSSEEAVGLVLKAYDEACELTPEIAANLPENNPWPYGSPYGDRAD